MPTNTTLVKIIDSPAAKTVTAIMGDNSEILLLAMSNENYVTPPGINEPITDVELVKSQLRLREQQYRSTLLNQLST